jgi:hypothetical protein
MLSAAQESLIAATSANQDALAKQRVQLVSSTCVCLSANVRERVLVLRLACGMVDLVVHSVDG